MITQKNKCQWVWLLIAIFSLPLFFKTFHHCGIEHEIHHQETADAENHDCEDCPICLFSFFSFIKAEIFQNRSFQLLLEVKTFREITPFLQNQLPSENLRAPPFV